MKKQIGPDSWVKKLVAGTISFYELPQEWGEEEQAGVRRRALSKLIRDNQLADKLVTNGVVEKARGRNCENIIGFTSVPVGVAGPLKIEGKYARGRYFVPLATTEGALVASINRGCKVISGSGGAKVMVEDLGATRGPVFQVKNVSQGQVVGEWVEKQVPALNRMVAVTSAHLKLKTVSFSVVGRNLYLRFGYDTSEAMGMNMVTVATEMIARFLERKFKIRCVAVTGNYCVDKKASWLNFIAGRGKKVQAEVVIERQMLRKVLKTNAEAIVEVVQRKVWLGSALAGSLGFNGHYANVVAAVFLATGQDLGHVVEGSLGITTAEVVENEGLYFSVYLPDIMVGTVGGGTGLPTQKAALSVLKLGKGKRYESRCLAEILGGAVLAGELSLTAALAEGALGRAHQRWGRGVGQ